MLICYVTLEWMTKYNCSIKTQKKQQMKLLETFFMTKVSNESINPGAVFK